MKRKIENYLNFKDKNEYSNLDRIFEMYFNGELKKILSKTWDTNWILYYIDSLNH